MWNLHVFWYCFEGTFNVEFRIKVFEISREFARVIDDLGTVGGIKKIRARPQPTCDRRSEAFVTSCDSLVVTNS